jgi:acylphosphatase
MVGMHRRTCYFAGRVQGVGFRYTAQNIALQHDVAGYVKNLPDGRVELVMEGPDPELDAVISSLRSRMTDYIRDLKSNDSPPTGEFRQFYIRH